MFWQEAKPLVNNMARTNQLANNFLASANGTPYTEQKLMFPASDTVWHFHPIAFVEQMRLLPKYKPDHGNFHDPIINPQ